MVCSLVSLLACYLVCLAAFLLLCSPLCCCAFCVSLFSCNSSRHVLKQLRLKKKSALPVPYQYRFLGGRFTFVIYDVFITFQKIGFCFKVGLLGRLLARFWYHFGSILGPSWGAFGAHVGIKFAKRVFRTRFFRESGARSLFYDFLVLFWGVPDSKY